MIASKSSDQEVFPDACRGAKEADRQDIDARALSSPHDPAPFLPPGVAEKQCPTLYAQHALAAYLLAFLFLGASLLYSGSWGVLESSEARYAEISREMLQSQDWLYPRLLGIKHLHKPPVVYWITALGLKMFGVTPFGARFFLQVSLVLQALLVFHIGCLLFRRSRPAFLAMAVYLTLPIVFIASRNLTTDSYLTTLELLAILAWITFKEYGRTASLYGFYASLGLAMLTKGPVGLLVPLLVCLVYRPAGSSVRGRLRAHLLPLLLFLLLALSWYVVLIWNDPSLLAYFTGNHTVQRMINPQAFGRSQPWWFFLALAPLLSLPWSVCPCWQGKEFPRMAAGALRLLLVWVLVPLALFSLSASKLILYILPLFAGLALLIGVLLDALPDQRLEKVAMFNMLFFLALSLALLLVPMLSGTINWSGTAGALALLMLIGLGLIWRCIPWKREKAVCCGLWFMLLLYPLSGNLLAKNPQLTSDIRPLADSVRSLDPQPHAMVVYNQLLPSLAFQANKNLVTVTATAESLKRETQFETDSRWQSFWLSLNKPEDQAALNRLLANGAILIAKEGAEPRGVEGPHPFATRLHTGRWRVYNYPGK